MPPRHEHYVAIQQHKLPGESEKDARWRRSEGYTKLKAAGRKEKYHNFTMGDPKGEAEAKALAEADALHWTQVTGIPMVVTRGFFL